MLPEGTWVLGGLAGGWPWQALRGATGSGAAGGAAAVLLLGAAWQSRGRSCNMSIGMHRLKLTSIQYTV